MQNLRTIAGVNPFNMGNSPGFDFIEIKQASGTLTFDIAGDNGGQVQAVQGDTLIFKAQPGLPQAFSVTSSVDPDPIWLRYGKGMSFSLANAGAGGGGVVGPIVVKGPLPYGSSQVNLTDYGNPVPLEMIFDESQQGVGPFDNFPLQTFSGQGLWTEQIDYWQPFNVVIAQNVPDLQNVRIMGSARIVLNPLGGGAAWGETGICADAAAIPIPFFDVQAGAWVYTGNIPNTATIIYVPLNGVGTLAMKCTSNNTTIHYAFSPRILPALK